MPKPERDNGGIASTRKEREAIMSMVDRYILTVGNSVEPGLRMVGWMS